MAENKTAHAERWEGYKPREEMRGRKIRGTWPDGTTTTATWDDYDEFLDDRYGDVVDFDEQHIGAPAEVVAPHTAHTFWDGCTSVEWVKPLAQTVEGASS